MKSFLSKSYTLKQILIFLLATGGIIFVLYIRAYISDGWIKQFGGSGYKDSPYAKVVPVECRKSAGLAGDLRMPSPGRLIVNDKLNKSLLRDTLLLRPTGYIYSLSESEKRLGFGMRGLPCMGYDFLMILHATDFKRKDLYINEAGDVVASITYEVIKPYRDPLPNNLWSDNWAEITQPPQNDSSLTTIKYRH